MFLDIVKKRRRRRMFLAALTGAGALLLICFIFPAKMQDMLTHAAFTIAESWHEAFGAVGDSGGGYSVTEIALGGAPADSSSGDAAGGSILNIPAGGLIGANESSVRGGIVATSAAAVIKMVGSAPAASSSVSSSTSASLGIKLSSSSFYSINASDTAASSAIINYKYAGELLDDDAATPAKDIIPPVCDFASAQAASLTGNLPHSVIINEVAWMGSPPLPGESASKAAGREWIELKNISASGLSTDVSNWQLADESGKIDFIFGSGMRLPGGWFFLLARGGGPDASGTLPGVVEDVGYSGDMVNSGDSLALFDSGCRAMDFIDAHSGWPAGDNSTKETMERDAAGFGWRASMAPGGTPRGENSAVVAPVPAPTPEVQAEAPAPAVPAELGDEEYKNKSSSVESSSTSINIAGGADAADGSADADVESAVDLQIMGSSTVLAPLIVAAQIAGVASDNDFVKIFNPAHGSVDISGWKLRKKSKSGAEYSLRVFPGGSVIAGSGYFIWANGKGGFGDSIGANVTSSETLAADNSIALTDASGVLIDAVAWGNGDGQFSEGAAFPENPEPGEELRRKSPASGSLSAGAPSGGSSFIDTNNNANDFTL